MAYPAKKFIDENVRASAATRWIIPAVDSDKLLLWNCLGDSSANLARRNLADRTLMDVAGSPVVNAGYTRTDVDDYFQSSILEPSETYEIFAFIRRSDTSAASATTGVVMGSFVGPTDTGLLLYWQTNAILRAQSGQGDNSVIGGSINVGSTEALEWKIYRVLVKWTGPTSGTITVYNETDGTTGATVGTFTDAPDPGSQPIRIGTSYSPTLAGHQEANQIVMFLGERTAEGRAAILKQMRSIASKMGVSEGA